MHVIRPELTYELFDGGHPEYIGSEKEEIRNAIRLWPHKLKGEGHFAALLKKDDGENCGMVFEKNKAVKLPEDAEKFLSRLGIEIDRERLELRENRLFMKPESQARLQPRVHRFCSHSIRKSYLPSLAEGRLRLQDRIRYCSRSPLTSFRRRLKSTPAVI
ncbi:MAG: hypothetical protein IKH06_06975, partial [Clostridiales bacterium]|nr:hypothetical protein [Clostridiales bacterium]